MDRRQLIATGFSAVALAMLPATQATAVEQAEDRFVILPDILRVHRQTVVDDPVNNWKTTHYEFMDRWHIVDGKIVKMETARVGSDRYAEWLAVTPPTDGIPPHISFSGCIVPGKGDPTFKARWEAETRREHGYRA